MRTKETQTTILEGIVIEINDAKEIKFTAKHYPVYHNYRVDKNVGTAIVQLKDGKMTATITLNTLKETRALNIKTLYPAIGYKVESFEGKGKDFKIINGELLNIGLCDRRNEDINIKNIGKQLKLK